MRHEGGSAAVRVAALVVASRTEFSVSTGALHSRQGREGRRGRDDGGSEEAIRRQAWRSATRADDEVDPLLLIGPSQRSGCLPPCMLVCCASVLCFPPAHHKKDFAPIRLTPSALPSHSHAHLLLSL